jgi:hypothetical protein
MEISMNRDTRRALAIALLMLVTGTLQAALVRGEDVPLNVDLNGQPTDPKIAEIQKIVHVKYEPFSSNFESVPQRPLDLDVQCISRVFRNEQTGFLTFTYGFDVVSPGTSDGFSEGSSGSVESYKGFGVNGLVSADELRKEVMLDSEGPNSTPGPVVVFSDLLRGTQHPPAFVLATNATRFDQNGIAKAHGEDEELLRNIETGQDQLDLIKGDTTVTGVFEPSAAIPLPAGVYPVSAMLAGGLIIRMLRMKKANVSQ